MSGCNVCEYGLVPGPCWACGEQEADPGRTGVMAQAAPPKRSTLIGELSPFDIGFALPWFTRHRPYVALNASRWGSEVYGGRDRPIIHVLLMWGVRFTDRGGKRSWEFRGRWRGPVSEVAEGDPQP